MLTLLVLSASALAGDLNFQWSAPVPLHAEVVIDTPWIVTLLGTEDIDARATQTQVALDILCKGAPTKRGWAVDCDIESARLGGLAVPGEQEKLDKILAEYGTLLDAASIELEIAADGRITSVDLEGVTRPDARHADVVESMRQLVRRALAPLDLQLPKDGLDPGKPWKQTGTPLALEMIVNVANETWSTLSGTGVAGGAALKTRTDGRDGAVVKLLTEGTGTTLIGESGKMVHMTLGAESRFDAERGVLLYRFLVVDGVSSAASSMASPSGFYHQAGAVGYRNPDGSIEGPTGPMGKASTDP